MTLRIQPVAFPFDDPPSPFSPITVDELERRFGEQGHRRRPRPSAPRSARGDAMASGTVELRLYVSADSMSCARALVTLDQLVRAFPDDALHVRVIDVARDVEAAGRDRVLFTPTLIVQDGARPTRVLGDLSNVRVLVELLRGVGIEPR